MHAKFQMIQAELVSSGQGQQRYLHAYLTEMLRAYEEGRLDEFEAAPPTQRITLTSMGTAITN